MSSTYSFTHTLLEWWVQWMYKNPRGCPADKYHIRPEQSVVGAPATSSSYQQAHWYRCPEWWDRSLWWSAPRFYRKHMHEQNIRMTHSKHWFITFCKSKDKLDNLHSWKQAWGGKKETEHKLTLLLGILVFLVHQSQSQSSPQPHFLTFYQWYSVTFKPNRRINS